MVLQTLSMLPQYPWTPFYLCVFLLLTANTGLFFSKCPGDTGSQFANTRNHLGMYFPYSGTDRYRNMKDQLPYPLIRTILRHNLHARVSMQAQTEASLYGSCLRFILAWLASLSPVLLSTDPYQFPQKYFLNHLHMNPHLTLCFQKT